MEIAAPAASAGVLCCNPVRMTHCWCGGNAGRRVIRATAAIFCSSSSIPDSRSKPWSDANLARELREFMEATGLPSDKVPTMKELASNGRKDLANVVRRRGYKAITELLASTTFKPAETIETSSSEDGDQSPETSTKLVVMNGSARLDDGLSTPLREIEYLKLARPASPSADDDTGELAAKAERFLRTGQLADTDDSGEETLYSSDDEYESVDASELEDETSEKVALKKAALLRSKLLPFLSSRDTASEEAQVGEKPVATNKKVHELLQKDKDHESQSKAQLLVDTLEDPKAALQAREKELSLLTRQLDEAKAHLALVQAKATAELTQAKQISIEKDMRLSAAENALTNLKQVKIEWWGIASKVELAGSFNGWQHFFVLEPDLSSEIRRPDGSRGPLMWETELWLYPGAYEMKFIVDGEWQIDHRREVVMKNMNQNNILRVDL